MTRKNNFSEGCCCLKFNNLELALGMTLKFYTSVKKRLRLKVRKLQRLIPTFVEVTRDKLVAGLFAPPQSWIGLRYWKYGLRYDKQGFYFYALFWSLVVVKLLWISCSGIFLYLKNMWTHVIRRFRNDLTAIHLRNWS